jgi:hypothetical protein
MTSRSPTVRDQLDGLIDCDDFMFAPWLVGFARELIGRFGARMRVLAVAARACSGVSESGDSQRFMDGRVFDIDSVFWRRSMPRGYSLDLRTRLVECVEAAASRHEAAERFEVSVSSAVRWMQRFVRFGSGRRGRDRLRPRAHIRISRPSPSAHGDDNSEIAPGLKWASIMFNPDIAPVSTFVTSFETAARSFKVEPIIAPVHSDAEIEAAITSLGHEPGGGLVVMPDGGFMLARRTQIGSPLYTSGFARSWSVSGAARAMAVDITFDTTASYAPSSSCCSCGRR